jgi:hypothetical protein
MGAPILHQGAVVLCAHAGQAQPTAPFPRVKVSGQPVINLSCVHTVAGCPFTPANGGNGPCVTGTWIVGSMRVKAGGMPVILQSSTAICAPTGTPLQVVTLQPRVTAQ